MKRRSFLKMTGGLLSALLTPKKAHAEAPAQTPEPIKPETPPEPSVYSIPIPANQLMGASYLSVFPPVSSSAMRFQLGPTIGVGARGDDGPWPNLQKLKRERAKRLRGEQ